MVEKFVRGGTDEVRPRLFLEEDMPRKRSLNEVQTLELVDMVRKGFSNKDIAKKFGIAESTVKTYYTRALRERGRENQRNGGGPRLVVIRNGTDKLLLDADKGYVGHTTIGGVEDTCVFKASGDPDAIVQFDKWLDDMQAEQEFMDRIERREPATQKDDADRDYIGTWDPKQAAMVLRGYSEGKLLRDVDRDMDVTLACEKRDARIAELEARVAELEEMVNSEKRQVAVGAQVDTAYALIAVRPKVKGYGMYTDMDAAFADLDKLNEVAAMLGSDGAFEVHEMEWRQ